MDEWIDGKWEWDLNKIISEVFTDISNKVAELKLFLIDLHPDMEAADKFLWKGNSSKIFSV